MSQLKVDKYKEYKNNKKEILAKQERKKKIEKIATWTITIGILGGLAGAVGVTIYNEYQKKLASVPNYTSDSYLLSDMTGVLSMEEKSEESKGNDNSNEQSTENEDASVESKESQEESENTSLEQSTQS